jgi:hypothetical protein
MKYTEKDKHTNHPSHSTGQSTKKTIFNFLLRKTLTIDFMKNVRKNKNMTDCITECPITKVKTKCIEN